MPGRRLRALGLLAALVTGCGGGGTPTPSAPTGPAIGVPVANEGWAHVPEGSAIEYRSNPPASGPHYPAWLRYQAYDTPLARGYWVHNLEHGAVVLLHRPDAPQAVIDALRAAYASLPPDPRCGHSRALLVPDPLMDRPFAVVAANWLLATESVDAAAIREFTSQHRGNGPESDCD